MTSGASYSLQCGGQTIRAIYPTEDDPIDVSSIVLDGYSGPTAFSYFFLNYNSLFSECRSSVVPHDKRIDKNGDHKTLHVCNSSALTDSFKLIAEMGGESDCTTYEESKQLLKAFKKIYSELDEQFSWTDHDAFIVPLKGGGVITKLFQLPAKNVIQIEAKRIPLKNRSGDFAFGMNVRPDPGHLVNDVNSAHDFIKSLQSKSIVMLEICVASGMTTLAFLTDLYLKKIHPKKITIMASAISQQAYEKIAELAVFLGFTNVEFIVGKVVYSLADYYFIGRDALLDDNGRFVVTSPWNAYKFYQASGGGQL